MADLTRALPFEHYIGRDGVNWSTLKEFAKSPAHYQFRADHDRPDTPRLAFGRAVHTAVLEPDRFPLEYVIFDGSRRAGKEWEAFAAANQDRTVLRREEYQACLAMRDSIRSHDFAADLLRGDSEVTAEWTDSETGIECKGRIDHINEDCIVDLKTTTSVDDWVFSALSARMLYHAQLAFYQSGVGMPGNPRIIAVEVDPPYDVAVFKMTDDLMLAGAQQVGDMLRRLKSCRESGEWPGRYTEERELSMPGWLTYDENDMTDLGIIVGGSAV